MRPWLKKFLFIVADCSALNGAIWFVFWTHALPQNYLVGSFSGTFVLNSLVMALCFSRGKLYKSLWKYAGAGDFVVLFKSVTTAILGCSVLYCLLIGFQVWFFWLEIWMNTLVLTGGTRLVLHLVRRRALQHLRTGAADQARGGKAVLVIGAGDAGAKVARALLDNDLNLQPVGFVDDAPEKKGMCLHGLPVLGSRQDIPRLGRELGVKEIIVAIPSAPPDVLREFVSLSREIPARLRIVPGIIKALSGQLAADQIRDIQVEDLLRREEIQLNLGEISQYLNDRVVLVTGAGGSIGSELCRQIAGFAPRLLVLVGHGENSIYCLHLELKEKFPGIKVAAEIADVRDVRRINKIFSQYLPAVVFHAAAHKHVPLMEQIPEEAFQNNVFGTRNVVRAADRWGVGTFVFISSDKAVNPVSIMGATKKVGEMLVYRMNEMSRTRFVSVRFGNVLGSRGSVVPLFQRQIAAGGPVTITDPEMSRYFMTVGEAVQLVIQAGAMAMGGETFVLDMGDPVKILDLARTLIDLSGMRKQVDIVFTGIRPGEKLQEELFTSEEGAAVTRHKRILVAQQKGQAFVVLDHLLEYGLDQELQDSQAVLQVLQALSPRNGVGPWTDKGWRAGK